MRQAVYMMYVSVYHNIYPYSVRYLVSVRNNRLEKLWEEAVLSSKYPGRGGVVFLKEKT